MKKPKPVSLMGVISLASIPLIMTLGNSMLIPVLPDIETELNVSAMKSSLLITIYSVASILLIPIAGYLSDKYGRKKIILPSLVIVFIGGLVSAIAAWKMSDPYWTIFFGRIFQGIGAAGAAPIVFPLVGDLYKKDAEASTCLGIIETSNTFGKVLSPILGAVLASVIWFLPFFMISAFSLVSFLLVLFFVKSPPRKPAMPFRQFLAVTKKIFKNEGRWLYTLFFVGGYAMFVLFALQVFLSDNLETQFHLKDVKKGLVLAVPLLFLCVSSLAGSKYIAGDKGRMKKIIIVSLLLQTAALLFFKNYEHLLPLMMVISLNGICIGLILPALDALITENIDKDQRGLITSFYSSARFFGVAAGPLVVSSFITSSVTAPSLIAASVTLLLTVVVIMNIQVDGKEMPKA